MWPLSGLAVKALMVLGALAAIMSGVMYLEHRGVKKERAKWELVQAQKIAARSKIITALTLDLVDVRGALAEERRQHRNQLHDVQTTYEGKLNAYVPPVADRDTCLRAGWVQYVDHAAGGVPLPARPNTPGGATAPAQVGTDAAAAVVERNYFKYHACVQLLADTVKAVDTERAKFNAAVRAINAQGAP